MRSTLGQENGAPAYRVVHSSADNFTGLTVDRLGEVFLVEQHQAAARVDELIAILIGHFGPNTPIFFKKRYDRHSAGRSGEQVNGPPVAPEFIVEEAGLKFSLNLTHEAHIGLFLDSREARAWVRRIAAEKRLLNLFSYTGSFGVAAAAGGAKSTTNIDNKRSALRLARINYEINNLPFNTRTFVRSDALDYLARALKGRGRYDIIIVDPPPRFKRSGGRWFLADRDYATLAARCMALLAPGGQLLAGLNAMNVSDDEFFSMLTAAGQLAEKQVVFHSTIGPGCDFPPCPDRPRARFIHCGINDPCWETDR